MSDTPSGVSCLPDISKFEIAMARQGAVVGAAPATNPTRNIMADKPKLKTNIHSIFQTAKNLEEDGAWVEVNGFYGLKIKVRRMRSEASMKAYERIVKETFGEGKLRRPQDLDRDQSFDILKRQLAEAVLIDWVNLRDTETGDEIPYSVDVARELMEIDDFREFVYQSATERDTFREKADADAEGN